MSNMTKTIAILGVVAGLGVAALPLSTYAADDTVTAKGDGELVTEDRTAADADGIVSTDTTIHLSIEDKLSIATSAKDVELTSIDDIDFSANAMTVTVITKNSDGYKLTMVGSADATTEGAKVTKKNALTNENGDEFAALSAAAATLSDSTWGYKVALNQQGADVAPADANWHGVEAASNDNAVIMSSTIATNADGDVASVTFGAKAAANQAAGTYKGRVTFTATNQPKATTGA